MHSVPLSILTSAHKFQNAGIHAKYKDAINIVPQEVHGRIWLESRRCLATSCGMLTASKVSCTDVEGVKMSCPEQPFCGAEADSVLMYTAVLLAQHTHVSASIRRDRREGKPALRDCSGLSKHDVYVLRASWSRPGMGLADRARQGAADHLIPRSHQAKTLHGLSSSNRSVSTFVCN